MWYTNNEQWVLAKQGVPYIDNFRQHFKAIVLSNAKQNTLQNTKRGTYVTNQREKEASSHDETLAPKEVFKEIFFTANCNILL